MNAPQTTERKVFNLYSAQEAREALSTAVRLSEQGEVFEVVVNYATGTIEVTRFFGARTDWRPKLHVTFSIDMVRITVSGRVLRLDLEAVLTAALIDKIELYRALERFIRMPVLTDIRVW